MVLADKLWLWGHPEGRYNNEFGNTKPSRMTPLEGAIYLGVRNMFMVPVGVDVNRRSYNKSFTTMQHVGWEIYDAGAHPEQLDQLLEEAKEFPNIDRGIFDDFFANGDGSYKDIPLENLFKVRDKLHNGGVRPLEMWMVFYTHQFGVDPASDAEFQPYIEPFDGVTMWTWNEKNVMSQFEEKYEIFKKMTAGKKKMLGLYLYDFGDKRQATGETVTWQLNRYSELLKAGEVEGIILHTNTMADLDYEAYDAALEWLAVHKNDPL